MLTSLTLLLSLACTGEPTEPPADHSVEVDHTKAPSDVAAAPATATVTESGLAYKVIAHGDSSDKPTEYDSVEVHYSGWTTDGKGFDNSYDRGKPASFPLKGVIAGWTEGLQFMSPGDTYRFWIPQDLAYKGMPGKPAGMLVFDVELISIKAGARPPATPESVSSAPEGASQLDEGLMMLQTQTGEGESPGPNDMVKFQMNAWDTTKGEFEFSSAMRGRPMSGNLGDLMPAWSKALATMKPGEKVLVWASAETLVDGRGNPADGPKTFELELLSVHPAPPTPSDVAKAPGKASKTDSGLAWMVLVKGTGEAHPTASDRVKVHYSGWTTDGVLFDSSVQRGDPATFGLGQVIPGWTEGLQLMVEGEKSIFWIPEELAYAGRPGKPAGMLVFEVELLEIQESKAMTLPPKH